MSRRRIIDVFMYHATHNLPVICVCPRNAYGPGGMPFSGEGLVALAVALMLSGRGILSYGAKVTILGYLHIRDMASGIIAELERSRAGECYNIGNGIGRSTREVIEAIVSCFHNRGYQSSICMLPERSFDMTVYILDSSNLMAETVWKSEISLDKGLLESWRWYVDNLKLDIPCP